MTYLMVRRSDGSAHGMPIQHGEWTARGEYGTPTVTLVLSDRERRSLSANLVLEETDSRIVDLERKVDTLEMSNEGHVARVKDLEKRLRQAEVERDGLKKELARWKAWGDFSPMVRELEELREFKAKASDRLAQVKMAVRDV